MRATAQRSRGVRTLRRARRRNRLAGHDLADRLYEAYVTAIATGAATWFLAGIFGGSEVTPSQVEWIRSHGPAAVGLAVVAVLALGLRSGGRGGPLNLEIPVVHYEVLAPIGRAAVLRSPALQSIRHAAFIGLVIGAGAGAVGAQSLHVDTVGLVTAAGATGLLAGATASGLAVVVSGSRLPRGIADLLAALLVGASLAEVVAGSRLLFTTTFGELALHPLRDGSVSIAAPVALAVFAVTAALVAVGGTSVEAARRRAGLVQHLRFAATMQDFRAVVLLRRQLAAEQLRATPWRRLPLVDRGSSARRVVRGVLRFPTVRVTRMIVLGSVAGVAMAFSPAVPVLLGGAAVCLFVAGYDAVEALAQEADHPALWATHPCESRRVVLPLAALGVVAMIPAGVAAIATALIARALVGGLSSADAALILWSGVLGAAGGAAGAAVSTLLGPVDLVKMFELAGGLPEFYTSLMLFRLVAPVALTAASLVPIFALSSTVSASMGLIGTSVLLSIAALGALGGSVAWLGTFQPQRA